MAGEPHGGCDTRWSSPLPATMAAVTLHAPPPPNVSRATKTTNHQSYVQEHSSTETVSILGDHTGWDPLESNWRPSLIFKRKHVWRIKQSLTATVVIESGWGQTLVPRGSVTLAEEAPLPRTLQSCHNCDLGLAGVMRTPHRHCLREHYPSFHSWECLLAS